MSEPREGRLSEKLLKEWYQRAEEGRIDGSDDPQLAAQAVQDLIAEIQRLQAAVSHADAMTNRQEERAIKAEGTLERIAAMSPMWNNKDAQRIITLARAALAATAEGGEKSS